MLKFQPGLLTTSNPHPGQSHPLALLCATPPRDEVAWGENGDEAASRAVLISSTVYISLKLYCLPGCKNVHVITPLYLTCILISYLDPTKGCVRQRRDVFFLLDGSGSITQSYFEKMKKFLVKLVEQLDVGPQGTHVGLLQFSHSLKTKIEFGFGEHKTFEEVKNAILQMRYQEGGTDTGNALEIVNKKVSYRYKYGDQTSRLGIQLC